MVIFEHLTFQSYFDALVISDESEDTTPASGSVTVYEDRQIQSVAFTSNVIRIQTEFKADRREDFDDSTIMIDYGIGFRLRVQSDSSARMCMTFSYIN